MKKLNLLLPLSALWFCFSANIVGQTPRWYYNLKGVEPLLSTKNEVEQLFSAAKINQELMTDRVHTVFYDDDTGKFTVEYSIGTCAMVKEKGYVVDRDVVLTIVYFPKTRPLFSNFKLGSGKFFKTRQGDDPGWHYISAELGFDFTVQRARVDYIERFPGSSSPTRDCK
jgi:hypothetical protein